MVFCLLALLLSLGINASLEDQRDEVCVEGEEN